MAEVDPVILEIRAELGRYKAELRSTTTSVEKLLGRQEKSVKRLEAEMKRSSGAIGNTLKGLAGTLAAGFGAREIGGLVDNFTRLQNALKVAGLEGEKLEQVQARLYELGGQYGVSVNALADLYGKAEQAGRELGASQAELLNLTTAVSQSILITGTSTEQASGAILGLTQALSSGTVRAEEFNQINEGGLRPLLEAAAASDRFGGSIAKLRNEVVEGTVSSQELYRAILQNADLIESKASSATLTLSGAFQSLNDQLGKYLGEAGQASGATGALAEAIKGLADNLDVIIPALATIAVYMGARTVASAIAGSNAVFAFSAALGGAATATEALTFALRGLQGIGIVAFLAGLVYVLDRVRQSSLDAAKATGEYAKQQEQLAEMQKKAEDATSALATATGRARVEALANAKALREEARQALLNAKAKAEAARQTARLAAISAQQEASKTRAVGGPLTRDQFGGTGIAIEGPAQKAAIEAQNNLRAANEAVKGAQAVVADLGKAIGGLAPVDTSGAGGGKTTKGRSSTGPSLSEIAFRQEQEIYRLRAEEIQARLQLTDDINERADLQAELDAIEYAARKADIEANEDLSRAQKDAQLKLLEGLFGVANTVDEQGRIIVRANQGLYAEIREREAQLEELRREGQLEADTARAKEDVLRSQLSITSNREERAALEQRILEIQIEAAKAELRNQIATLELAEGREKEVALLHQRLADLDTIRANEAEGISRDNESPLARYNRRLGEESLEDQAEQLIVDEIEHVRRGMRDAIADAIGTDDPLITGLIDLLIQELVIKPLANGLSQAGGGGGGGLLGGIVSIGSAIFGRASGGRVNPGQLYRVNEGASAGRVEAFRPDVGGDIIPLGRMNLASEAGAQAGGTVKVVIEEGPGFASRVRTEATGVAVEVQRAAAPQIINAAANETARRFSRPTL